jgi:trk system potassium uptake protein TrkA
MKAVIIGCGRVGALLAGTLDAAGHQVIILDTKTSAFDRLPQEFSGSATRGDGTDEDVLRRAGAADADLFLALTEGDNRNVMAGQLAVEALGAREVIVKINDPVRADAYAALGIATLCRTNLMADAVYRHLGLPTLHAPGVVAPTGSHHDREAPPSGPMTSIAATGSSGPSAREG